MSKILSESTIIPFAQAFDGKCYLTGAVTILN